MNSSVLLPVIYNISKHELFTRYYLFQRLTMFILIRKNLLPERR